MELSCFEIIYNFYQLFLFFLFNLINFLINYLQTSIKLNFFSLNYTFTFNNTFIFGLKFLVSIAFLVLIRGGTPRYRYDYLTKLGWLKFINIIIFIFFFTLFIFYVF